MNKDASGRARPDDLPNPTANASLTDPGPAPATSAAGSGDEDLIPWDPTGKIDDLVERRNAPAPASSGSPKGGGASPAQADVGPGRYGGATDDAPTSPTEGATTTLASLAAEAGGHTMRETSTGSATGETWTGGQASQEAMQAPEEFASQPPPTASAPHHHHHVEPFGGGGGSGEVH